MNKVLRTSTWGLFGLSCIMIGLYPIIYFVIDRHFGLLSTKSQALLADQVWNVAFYGHIILGGLSLFIGWTQFIPKLRKTRMGLHRTIGKIYVVAVIISGICGLYIAQFATGGLNNVIAFSMSGIFWLTTTILAFRYVKAGNINMHQKMMIYSYAVCFSAVTLRIWLPIFTELAGGFHPAYKIVSWLSWVPNVIVAFFIIRRMERNQLVAKQL